MFLKLIIILLLPLIIFYLKKSIKKKTNRKVFKAKRLLNFNKNNLNKWMNLTKKERYKISEQESINYLNKRKVLLREIRKEYKKISKGNSTQT